MTCPLSNSPSLHVVQNMPTSGNTVPDPPRQALSFPQVFRPSLPLSLGAPEAFTWPKVHAHWAQSGPQARSVFPSQARGLVCMVGEMADRRPSAKGLHAGSVDPKA